MLFQPNIRVAFASSEVRTLILADASTLLINGPWNSPVMLAQTTTTAAPAGPVIDLKGPQAIALVIAIGLGVGSRW